MPWVSETTTSFSAFMAAATAPAAVSALTLSRLPAASRAIVAMHGNRVGLHQQLQQPGVDAGDFADQAQIDPPAVGAGQISFLGEQHDAGKRMQAHRLATLGLDEIDDEPVDLVAQDLLGDGQGAFIGVSPAHDHLRLEAGRFHRLVDRLPAAVDEDRLHADVIHEDDVVEQIGERLFIVHDGPADFDDDDFVVESLDVAEGFHKSRSLVDGESVDGIIHDRKSARERKEV